MAKCIMVQGTMSGAGKSLLVTALCRIFAQDGYRVAPFKSQNMALNSFVTADGLELGRAQAVQAEAAGIPCDVRMNPILLKPSSDTGSQLIVMGEVRGQYDAKDYFRMKRGLIPEIMKAYNSLAEEHDIIVIEGAGSPAEINLREDDIVNMGLAELVNAPVILAGDIDRGGVFAQLYGTVALLRPEERKRLIGTVINKFRGDVELLRPGLRQLEELTGVPVLGVLPWMKVDIDDEDSLAPRLEKTDSAGRPLDIAVIRLPHVSNFTDFSPLEEHPALGVRYVKKCRDLGDPVFAPLKFFRIQQDTILSAGKRKGDIRLIAFSKHSDAKVSFFPMGEHAYKAVIDRIRIRYRKDIPLSCDLIHICQIAGCPEKLYCLQDACFPAIIIAYNKVDRFEIADS